MSDKPVAETTQGQPAKKPPVQKKLWVSEDTREQKRNRLVLRESEDGIIRVLAKYRLLDAAQIKMALNDVQPSDHIKNRYDKDFELLYANGFIKKYEYGTSKKDEDKRIFYALAGNGYRYVKKKHIRLCYKPVKQTEKYSKETVIETSRLNQWHLRLKSLYEDDILEEYYEHSVRVLHNKYTVIPSYFVLRNKNWRYSRKFSIVSIPFPQNDDEKSSGTFLNSLLSINAFIKESGTRTSMTLILTENYLQIQKAAGLIRSYTPLEGMVVYYIPADYVKKSQPLSWIFKVEPSGENEFSYTKIDIAKPVRKDDNE